MISYVKVLSAALFLPLVVGTLWPGLSCGSNRGMGTTGGEAGRGEGRAERLAAGVWNGEHVSMEVNEGGAAVEFDCAHGSIKQPLALDASGRFSVRGTFAFEQGGPETPGGSSGDRPARYAGLVEGKKMTLTVTLTDNNQTIDTFTLIHDATYQVTKCL